jgi:hypothetical protein
MRAFAHIRLSSHKLPQCNDLKDVGVRVMQENNTEGWGKGGVKS